MPLIKHANMLPEWAEVKDYEILRLSPGEAGNFNRKTWHEKEKWIICEGSCELLIKGSKVRAGAGDEFNLLRSEVPVCGIGEVLDDLVLIRISGEWGEEVGGSGVFSIEAAQEPGNPGDPTDYRRNTYNDNHYHDCDEYYMIYDGLGVVVSEGRHYIVSAGDCILTGMGHHHDIPIIVEPIKAIFFETTLKGQKRKAHLWNHTHGPAQPDPQRI